MRRAFLTLSAVLAALPACSDSSTDFWLPSNDLMPMVAMRSSVAFVEKNTGTAFLLDPSDPSLTPTLVPVGKSPVTAVRHAGLGEDRLLVLSAGDRGSAAQAPVSPQLFIVDPHNTAGPPWRADLASRFDGVVQSADGQYVVLYHTSSAGNSGDDTLFNPNDLLVADFSAGVTGAPTMLGKSIRSLGGTPASIRFSPLFGQHRLAVVLSQSYVTVFDLRNPAQSEISLPLCATSSCNVQVEDVVFDGSSFESNASFNIYIRASGAKDIFQVSLTQDTNSIGLTASMSMLGVGASAADMVLYGSGANARLAVVAPTGPSLVIIDPSTANAVTVTLPIPANKIVPFVNPNGGQPRYQGMLVNLKGSTSVLFADFGSAQSSSGSAVNQLAVSGSVSDVVMVSQYGDDAPGAANVAILTFANNSGGPVRSVVKLDSQSFFDFSTGSALVSPTLEIRGVDHSARLWSVASPPSGAPSRNSGIYYRDLPTAADTIPDTIWLDQTIESITPLEQASGDTRYLVLEHQDLVDGGNLTFLDADRPSRATARTAYGFLFANYLGRTRP